MPPKAKPRSTDNNSSKTPLVLAVVILGAALLYLNFTQYPSASTAPLHSEPKGSREERTYSQTKVEGSIFVTDPVLVGYQRALTEMAGNLSLARTPNEEKWGIFLTKLFFDRRFPAKIWEKKPFLVRNLTWFVETLKIDEISEVYEGSELTASFANFLAKKGADSLTSSGTESELTREFIENLDTTFAINRAMSLFPEIRDISYLWTMMSGIYSNINVYVTPEGIGQSAPPHNDRQNVFILQSSGTKRWRLYEPTIRLPSRGQIRGKTGDAIPASELEDKFVAEVTLYPGDLLYIPRGMIHATFSDNSSPEAPESHKGFSIHYTVGLETETLAYTYESILGCAAGISKSQELILAVQRLAGSNPDFRRSIEFGFLGLKHTNFEEVRDAEPFLIHELDKVAEKIVRHTVRLAEIVENEEKTKFAEGSIFNALQLWLNTYKERVLFMNEQLLRAWDLPKKERQGYLGNILGETNTHLFKNCGINLSDFN
eukprot:TRINITY_DN4504_c0_g1_i1.p1 TRINITY_DN4504_c0_g1~~TRINITY_DN4504_c0_g1_i1.p1  ORF type:complete len:497 (+),score=86.42 TRINITY_DN4504_c0_g1_i1:33-1493(+)